MNKYFAVATRKNLTGKPDYKWYARYATGDRMVFKTAEEAEQYARSACSETMHAIGNPHAEPVPQE